ncbi:MAG: 50S ribosomal protein L30e [archaeon]
MNLENALRAVTKTGKVQIGSRAALKNSRSGAGKLIILSQNCVTETFFGVKQNAELTKVPVFVFEGTSNDLGTACKKPFPISAITIFESGDSDILDLLKKK